MCAGTERAIISCAVLETVTRLFRYARTLTGFSQERRRSLGAPKLVSAATTRMLCLLLVPLSSNTGFSSKVRLPSLSCTSHRALESFGPSFTEQTQGFTEGGHRAAAADFLHESEAG